MMSDCKLSTNDSIHATSTAPGARGARWRRRIILAAIVGIPIVAMFPMAPRSAAALTLRAGTAGTTSLPYQVQDNSGNGWILQRYGGYIQQQGNQPVISQGGMLTINGNQVGQQVTNARQDEKTGEIVIENMAVPNLAGLTISRRALFKLDDGYVRIVDVFKNTTNKDLAVPVQIVTSLNYGVPSSQMVNDTKKKDQPIAWVALTHAQRSGFSMFAGKGGAVLPTIDWQQGNNSITASYQLNVPAGKAVAIVHLHGVCGTVDQGVQLINNIREAKLISDLPPDVRRLIVNWPSGGMLGGDLDILRGDLTDVVELRGSGDQVRGTLKDASYKLETFYGSIDLPAEKVIGLLNLGAFHPRTLIVTSEGEIFGGKLARENMSVELSSGQATQVPLSQVSRAGYRKRPGEADEIKLDKSYVILRSGDRIGISIPATPIDVATRYGTLKLDPKAIARIDFQSDDGGGVHLITLTDGSKFAGVVPMEQFPMKLDGAAGTGDVNFPAASIRRLQISTPSEEEAAAQAASATSSTSPLVDLTGADKLTATLTGVLKLDTSFDTLSINAQEIRSLTHAVGAGATAGSSAKEAPAAGEDVQIVLWDQTAVSGQLSNPTVDCQLVSGPRIKVPIALIEQYTQPSPQPSAAMREKIKGIVTKLSAEDWKERDRAEQELVQSGPVVVGILKGIAAEGQLPPEAQQRIESVLRQLEKGDKKGAGNAAKSPQAQPMIIND